MNETATMVRIEKWISEPLGLEISNALNKLGRSDDVCHLAVMPDVHLANDVCIGVVMATKDFIYPQAIGQDIGCGMTAIRFHDAWRIFQKNSNCSQIYKGLGKLLPIIKHPGASAFLPDELKEYRLSHKSLEKLKSRDGRYQFATLGRGNHFLEFQLDEEMQIWLCVHSGSRNIGRAINDFHLRQAKDANTGLKYLLANSAAGKAYVNDLGWAVNYAKLSREYIISAVSEFFRQLYGISVEESSLIDCCHNHVQQEKHFQEDFWVHRKGAIQADENILAIIPGSMGSFSYHVYGKALEKSLRSASHGAGRQMSRSEAHKNIAKKAFQQSMKGISYDRSRESSLIEEAPQAYKDIDSVMRAQADLVKIMRKLRPVLNYKG